MGERSYLCLFCWTPFNSHPPLKRAMGKPASSCAERLVYGGSRLRAEKGWSGAPQKWETIWSSSWVGDKELWAGCLAWEGPLIVKCAFPLWLASAKTEELLRHALRCWLLTGLHQSGDKLGKQTQLADSIRRALHLTATEATELHICKIMIQKRQLRGNILLSAVTAELARLQSAWSSHLWGKSFF